MEKYLLIHVMNKICIDNPYPVIVWLNLQTSSKGFTNG